MWQSLRPNFFTWELYRTQLGELEECTRQQGESHILLGFKKTVVGTSLG